MHFNINYIMRDMVSANYIYKYLAIGYNVGEYMYFSTKYAYRMCNRDIGRFVSG